MAPLRNATPETPSVLVYRLYDEDALEERNAALPDHLARSGQSIDLWVEPLPGGCFRWEDGGRLHRNEWSAPLPESAADARRCAAAYMRAANDAAAHLRGERGLDRARHPDPFPIESLEPVEARRIRSHADDRDDQWLTTWRTVLPTGAGKARDRALVIGAIVEVRVGTGGHVVAGACRARPWQSVAARPALSYVAEAAESHAHRGSGGAADHHHGGHEHEHAHEPAVVYLLDNPYEPQRFLAPCWLIPPEEEEEDHHARRLWPASDHTVLPEIFVEQHGGEATVWPLVLAAGRQIVAVEDGEEWSVRWSVAGIADYGSGERRVIRGTNAPLPGPGVYYVELELEHVPTGAVRSTYQQIAVARADDRARGRQPEAR